MVRACVLLSGLETDGHHLGYHPWIRLPPLISMGTIVPWLTIVCSRKHTISYIQQASHEWIEGDEEETIYTQATKSLRVVPTDIQHRPEVL